MFSCLQILEAFLWFVLITLLNVTLIILTLSVSRLLNLLLRLVAFLLFLNPQCLASISKIGRAVQQECRDRSRMPSSAGKKKSALRARRHRFDSARPFDRERPLILAGVLRHHTAVRESPVVY